MRQEHGHLRPVLASGRSEPREQPGGYRVGFVAEAIVDLKQRERVLYSECLARLLLPGGHLRMPSAFIPGLETLGKITELDRFLLELTLAELDSKPTVSLGCNLSPENLATERNWSAIVDCIAQHRHLAPRLVLELTESRPLDEIPHIAQRLAQVRDLGCRIAIDDFGAGHASPSRLLSLDMEIDIVKIDKSFLHARRRTPSGKDSLLRIIGLALCLAPVVVAEGIETKEHLAIMKAAGATHGQGFLFPRDAPGRWRAIDHSALGDLIAQVIEPYGMPGQSPAPGLPVNLLSRLWSLMPQRIGRRR